MNVLRLPRHDEIRAEQARRRLLPFIEQAWHVIEPITPFVSNWHIGCMCEHLEAVSMGQIKDILFNVPPGHMKPLAVDTPVLTLSGWVLHGDLQPGQCVLGQDGLPRLVEAVTPHGIQPTLRVRFDDGASVVAGVSHLWLVERGHNSEIVSTAELLTSPNPDSVRASARARRRYVVAVEDAGDRSVNCIQVEGGLYLAGKDFVLTHNSISSSVMLHPWEWIKRPELRYLCGSYDDTISLRDNIKARNIIESEWYQRHFPLELSPVQNAKGKYENVKTGWRIGTSVNGRGTGEHPHRKIIDDPHNVKQSLSDQQREEALRWFSLTMASRGVALGAATIVVMQRLHEGDLSGHILENLPHYVHVCLPLRYEPPAWFDLGDGKKELKPRMKTTPIGFDDPRTVPGELLWPALFDEPKVDKMELELRSLLGEYGVAGQCQQRPSPEKGGFFDVAKIEIVDAMPAVDQVSVRARGWDAAGTDDAGDFTVGTRLSITHGGTIFIEDVVRDQVGPGDDDLLMRQTGLMDPRDTRHIEEQEGGSAGKKVIHAHGKGAMAGLAFEGTTAAGKGSKKVRARPFASQVNLGNVKLVRGVWNKPYLDELRIFPNGLHDDQVDASVIAYNGVALDVPSTITFGRTTSGR